MKYAIFSSLFLCLIICTNCSKDETPTPAPVNKEPQTPAISIDFSFSVKNEEDPLTIQFDNATLHADQYDWDFGDGNTSTTKDPLHTFPKEGDYTVTLKAYTKKEQKELFKTVTVLAPSATIAGTWDLITGEYQNTAIADLKAELIFKENGQYSASFSIGSEKGSASASYTLEEETKFKSNLPESLILNGISFSSDGMGGFHWRTSISASRSTFLNYGGVALGWSKDKELLYLTLDQDQLILSAEDGKTKLIYRRK